MLKVPIDKIIPVTEARANISKVVNDVEKGEIYVLTRGGKPSCVVAPVEYIKKCDNLNIDANLQNESNRKDKAVQSNNHLLENHDVDNLPAKISSESKKPIVKENNQTELTENSDVQKLPTEYKKPKDDIVKFDEEEKVPIKVASGSWDE